MQKYFKERNEIRLDKFQVLTLKRNYLHLALLLLIGLLLSSHFIMAAGKVDTENNSIKLTLEAIPPVQLAGQSITLLVHFKNVTKTPVSLLKVFEPIPVFFSVKIIDRVSDSPIEVPGSGKIDFFGKPDVEIIQPNQEYVVKIDLGQLLGAKKNLKRGLYDITVTYHNQYGEEVMKDKVSSNVIQIRLLDKDD
jgi:hypothetical protein